MAPNRKATANLTVVLVIVIGGWCAIAEGGALSSAVRGAADDILAGAGRALAGSADDAARATRRGMGAAGQQVDDAAALARQASLGIGDDLARAAGQGGQRAGALTSATLRRAAAGSADDLARVGQFLVHCGITLSDDATRATAAVAERLVSSLKLGLTDEILLFAARFGDDAALLAERLGPRAAVYLRTHGDAMIAALRRARVEKVEPAFLEALAKYGSRFVEHLDRHKVLYAGGAAFVAVVTNPQPYLDAGVAVAVPLVKETATTVGQTVARETARAGAEMATDTVRTLGGDRLLVLALVTLGLVTFRAWRRGWFERTPLRPTEPVLASPAPAGAPAGMQLAAPTADKAPTSPVTVSTGDRPAV